MSEFLMSSEEQAGALDEWVKFTGAALDPELGGNNSDLFRTNYIGYWARGIEVDSKLGWLVYEMDESAEGHDEDELHAIAVAAWRAGEVLPPRYSRLDRPAAVRAYNVGVRRWGERWAEERGDSTSYDCVVQMALLGEVRYG
jgi:hypothetical protein